MDQKLSHTARDKSGRNLSLDGLRGIAALGVVVTHILFAMVPFLSHNLNSRQLTLQPFALGSIASWPIFNVLYNGGFEVSIFFVLSGYVLTQRVIRTGDGNFLVKGALKRYPRLILPALFSCLFAWCLLQAGLMHTDLSPAFADAGWVNDAYTQKQPLLRAIYQGLIGAPIYNDASLNRPLWTIHIEFIGSLLLFLCYWVCSPTRPVIVAAMFCVITAVISRRSNFSIYYVSLLLGSLLNYVQFRGSRFSGLTLALFGMAGLIFGSAYSSILPTGLLAHVGMSLDLWIVLSQSIGAILLVFAIISAPASGVANMLSSAVPAWLGRVSFSLYLVHWPIICSVGFMTTHLASTQFGMGVGQSVLASGTAVLVVALVVSELVTRYVDQPCIRLASYVSNKALLNGTLANKVCKKK